MAPEVMKSEKCTQKADVYSYGILLWEILTEDVLFKNMRDVQATLAVVSSNTRPMMPQNCSPRIAKLIKICWDKDPDKRPDFETICKMFESGEMDFPGTRYDEVVTYMKLFRENASKSTAFDPKVSSKSVANDLITELARNDDESFYALLKLQKVITKED